MSSLAFAKLGEPFAWHQRSAKLRVRLLRTPSARRTCCQVLDGSDSPLFIEADIDYIEFRRAISGVIASPMNDHSCLGPTTQQIPPEVEAGNPALADLAERFTHEGDLAEWFRMVPQRDDADETPTKRNPAKGAIKDSVTHLPDTFSTVASTTGDAFADTAQISLAPNPPWFAELRQSPILLAKSAPRVWPLAAINGHAPAVLDERRADLRGVDLAYPRIDIADAVESCPIGTPHGTATHLMPAMIAALAIDGGEIMFAGQLGHGFVIIINHGNGWASHYANLQAIVAIRTDLHQPRAQYVRAGDAIGYVGSSAPDAFKQLHFELSERDRDRRFVPVDPRPRLATWNVGGHYDAFTPAPPKARTEAA